MGRKPKNELASLARTARAQIARAEVLGKSLDVRLKMKREAAPDWTPDDDFRRDLASITHTIQHAGNAMREALAGNKKDLGGLTIEQLEAQFNAELIHSAQTMSDEEWARLVAARAKARQQ